LSFPFPLIDYNVPHPGQTFKRFKSAEWSPDGDKLAFIDSDLNVRVLEAPANPISGPWTVNRSVRPVDGAGKDALAVQIISLDWSSQNHLAMGTRTGQIHIAHDRKVVKLADIGSAPVTALSWSSSLTSSEKSVNGDFAATVRAAPDTETDSMLLAVQSTGFTILHIAMSDSGVRLRSLLQSGNEVPRGLQISVAKFLERENDSKQPQAVVCTSPGAVHTWHFIDTEPDAPRKQWRTCQLLPSEEAGTEGERDPHAEAIGESWLYLKGHYELSSASVS
jgi:WD40 repeat protein